MDKEIKILINKIEMAGIVGLYKLKENGEIYQGKVFDNQIEIKIYFDNAFKSYVLHMVSNKESDFDFEEVYGTGVEYIFEYIENIL